MKPNEGGSTQTNPFVVMKMFSILLYVPHALYPLSDFHTDFFHDNLAGIVLTHYIFYDYVHHTPHHTARYRLI